VSKLNFWPWIPADWKSLGLAFTYPEIFLPHHVYADKLGRKVVCVTVDGLTQIVVQIDGRNT